MSPEPAYREVRFHFSPSFPQVLAELGCSLFVSTYQAGKLAVVSADGDQLRFSFHNFEQAMGLALRGELLAVGTQSQIWFLHSVEDLASQVEPRGQHDTCFVSRSSFVTGNIHGHEMAWSGDELWVVNTLFSCLSTLHDQFSFVPRWRPPFISSLAGEDRCHLNGLAMDQGKPRFVTAMAESDEAEGWRPTKATSGCVIDVESGQTIARGLTMPHSPRLHDGRLWVLDSGRGALATIDPNSGKVDSVEQLPGYVRGLAIMGPYAFVGLSRIRESAVFGGVPIAERRDELKCGVGVVDLRTGQSVAALQFETGVEEIFDVQIVPDTRCPALVGPNPAADDTKPVWVVPNVDQVSRLSSDPFHLGIASAERNRTAQNLAGQSLAGLPTDSNQNAIALVNHGNQHLRADRFDEAATSYRQAMELCPDLAVAHIYHGTACHYQMQLDAAMASFKQALLIEPNSADAHLGLAMLLLHAGNFRRGWDEYEWRWQCDGFGERPTIVDSIAPAWDGAPLEGKTILVYPEQGVGDDIMFATCLPDLAATARRCIVLTRPRLVPLLARSIPDAEVHSNETLQDPGAVRALGQIDFQVAAGSLPRFFRGQDDEFPQRRSYLQADPNKIEFWRARYDELGAGHKIGISWSGGADPTETRRRSIELSKWQPILNTPHVKFVNLQYGQWAADLRAVDEQFGVTIHDWQDVDPLEDMDGFAAQVAALDLVISIDNSTVHLAGALGVPVWMLAPPFSASGWRWIAGREDSNWYRSLRLFRQSRMGDWEPVLQRVANELKAVAAAESPSEFAARISSRPVPASDSASYQAATMHNDLGNAHQEADDQDTALSSYRQAIIVDETFAPAHQNLGFVLINHGCLEEGRPYLERAQQLQPADVNRVMLATALPVVYQSVEQLQAERQRLLGDVRQLVDGGIAIDTTHTTVPTNFFSAYQGYNEHDVQADLGRIHRGVDLCLSRSRGGLDGRIKIGLLSDHFRNHTIGRLNLGLVKHLAREKFEVTLLSVGRYFDPMAEEFRRAADRYIEIPNRIETARRTIAEQKLDVLLFTDIGMHHMIYTLAFSRMAPIQCATWGHPVTTGSPTIDYFVSSETLETPPADSHYTEALVRLPRLGVYYERPRLAGTARGRAFFGLDDDRHVYLCPQTLFKFHPQFDEVLAGILRADPKGDLVLIEGRVPHWTSQLRGRMKRTMPDVASRIRFLPAQPHAEFMHLHNLADVALDTIHFSGGNTSYESFGVGLPVVTWPGQFMRGRITYALYQQMGISDCVAQSAEQYIDLAVQLGTDRTRRQQVRQSILSNAPAIFEDQAAIHGWQSFLESIV